MRTPPLASLFHATLPHRPIIYMLVPRKARLMYLRFAWPRFAPRTT